MQQETCSFQCITSKFLAMHPVQSLFSSIDVVRDDKWQQNLLTCTLKNPVAVQYPPSRSYIITFLKRLVQQLEQGGAEVIDELYEALGQIIGSPPADVEFCFKTYVLDQFTYIVMKESVNIVSDGTTGLCTWPLTLGAFKNSSLSDLSGFFSELSPLSSEENPLRSLGVLFPNAPIDITGVLRSWRYCFSGWSPPELRVIYLKSMRQASLCLAEWLLENKDIVTGRKVAELGSGLGFLGIFLAKACNPSELVLSDCHDSVLNKLVENVERNTGAINELVEPLESTTAESSTRTVWRCMSFSGNTSLSIMKLDWEHVNLAELLEIRQNLEVVVAADVVYDSSIVQHLVHVLSLLLLTSEDPSRHSKMAFVASTVRNPATLEEFTTACS